MCHKYTDYYQCGHPRRTRLLPCDRSYSHLMLSERGHTYGGDCDSCVRRAAQAVEPWHHDRGYLYRYRYYSRERAVW
jgi:hypothetical protein